MTSNLKLNLLLGIHSHISEDLFSNNNGSNILTKYLDLVEALEKNQYVKANIHFSGNTLTILDKKTSNFTSNISKLLQENRLELIGGGLFEPLFPFIPKEDRQTQLSLMNRLLNHLFAYTPHGAWTTEFAWEPSLAYDFAKSKAQYTCLPKEYFSLVGLDEIDLSGYFVTEDEGRKLSIFPITFSVEDLIKEFTPEEVIKNITSNSEQNSLVVLFCHDLNQNNLQWLLSFIKLINDNSTNIKSNLFSEYFLNNKPQGRIYLPSTNKFSHNDTEAFWKQSLLDCFEANLLHKKMLRVSKKINSAKEGKSRFKVIKEMLTQAQELLLKGQSNDTYLTNNSDGIYQPTKRHNAYKNLIQAENLIDNASRHSTKWIQVSELDYDCDGNDEIIVETETNIIYISPHMGGTILEHDFRPRCLNVTNVFSEEQRHKKIKKQRNRETEAKLTLVDHFLDKNTLLEDCLSKNLKHLTNKIINPYLVEKIKAKEETCKVELKLNTQLNYNNTTNEVELIKQINLRSGESSIVFDYSLVNKSEKSIETLFAIEFNLNTSTYLDPNSYFYLNGNPQNKTNSPHLDSIEQINEIKQISVKSNVHNLNLTISCNKSFHVFRYPIKLIYNEVDKDESIFQGVTILLNWPLVLEPNLPWTVSLKQDIETTLDYEN